MKTVCIALLSAVSMAFVQGATTPQFQQQVRPIVKSCQEESKATGNDVEDVINLNTNLTREGQCLLACAEHKLGIMKDNKSVPYKDSSAVYQTLFADDPERLKGLDTVVDMCIKESEEKITGDVCALAHAGLLCFLRHTY